MRVSRHQERPFDLVESEPHRPRATDRLPRVEASTRMGNRHSSASSSRSGGLASSFARLWGSSRSPMTWETGSAASSPVC